MQKIIKMKSSIYVLVLILLVSCNPWKFVSEYDREVDFDTYKTFGLLNWDPHNDKIISSQNKEYLLLALKNEMEARGYVYQENDADLQVSIFAIVQEETNYAAYSNHYAGYSGYGYVGVGASVGSGGAGVGVVGYGLGPMYPYTVYSNDYEVGTLVIDLLDHTKKQIVWQGVASGRLGHEAASKDEVERKMGLLFKKMPVKKLRK
jgi:hypothetical protein